MPTKFHNNITIDPSVFYNDPVIMSLPPQARELYWFLLVGPHTNRLPGLARIGTAQMAEACRLSTRTLHKWLQVLHRNGLTVHDGIQKCTWCVHGTALYAFAFNPNMLQGWCARINQMPPCRVRDYGVQQLREWVKAQKPSYLPIFDDYVRLPAQPVTEAEMWGETVSETVGVIKNKNKNNINLSVEPAQAAKPLPPPTMVAPPQPTSPPDGMRMMVKAAPAGISDGMMDVAAINRAIVNAVNDPNYSGHMHQRSIVALAPCHPDELASALGKLQALCLTKRPESRWNYVVSCITNERDNAALRANAIAADPIKSTAQPKTSQPITVPAKVKPFKASDQNEGRFLHPEVAKTNIAGIMAKLSGGMDMNNPSSGPTDGPSASPLS